MGRKRRKITMLLHNEDDEERIGCAIEVKNNSPPYYYNQINHKR
jgi:hypothetical protein